MEDLRRNKLSGDLRAAIFGLLAKLCGYLPPENFSLCLGVFVVRPKHPDFSTEAQNSMIPFFEAGGGIVPEE